MMCIFDTIIYVGIGFILYFVDVLRHKKLDRSDALLGIFMGIFWPIFVLIFLLVLLIKGEAHK